MVPESKWAVARRGAPPGACDTEVFA